jgi:hypothetical protein
MKGTIQFALTRLKKEKMYRYRNSIEPTFFTVLLDFCLLDFSEEKKNMAWNKMPLFSLKVRCEKKSLFMNEGGSPKIDPHPQRTHVFHLIF